MGSLSKSGLRLDNSISVAAPEKRSTFPRRRLTPKSRMRGRGPIKSWSHEKCEESHSLSDHINSSTETEALDSDVPPPAPEVQDFCRQFDLLLPAISEYAILDRLCCWMRRTKGEDGEFMAEAFEAAPTGPPVTKQSLGELNVDWVVANAKLRHDINFDEHLHFRPNLDGNRGRRKMKAMEDYWLAITAELELYGSLFGDDADSWQRNSTTWPDIVKISQRRIPRMFREIKDVLKSLVPDRDKALVDEQLDVGMLMQKIEKGVCDLYRIAQWLARLLKSHCAPMRDALVDKMEQYFERGVTTGDNRSISRGLKELFGILEAMKLVS